MKIASYLRVGSDTTLNIILYAATLGKYLWLEGRVRRGVFRNWAARFRYAPIMYAQPSKEEEIVRAVRNAAKDLRALLGARSEISTRKNRSITLAERSKSTRPLMYQA